MTPEDAKCKALTAENQALHEQLAEAHETLRAIHQGEVDALVVSTPQGPQIYTLSGAETPYRILIEEMREGAVMLSDNNSILYCNRGFSEMVQVTLDKLVGSSIENVVASEHVVNLRNLLVECRSGKVTVSTAITFQASPNKMVPTVLSANCITTNNTATTFIVVTDLSKHMEADLKRYTEDLELTVRERTNQLRDKERLAAIGQTASMVGHDIRNPLQSIVSELYLARQEIEDIPSDNTKNALKESLQLIEEQTFYINKIVADLQDYTKPLTPKPQLTKLDAIVKESLSSIITPENISVSLNLQENAPEIKIDPLFLKRVLINLISNGFQAMPNGGKLNINTEFSNKQAVITVKDTGTGIPENVKHQIFQPLFTTKAKGQGLGLAVVKRLTDASKGTVYFESELGKGTAFIVKLPLDTEKAA